MRMRTLPFFAAAALLLGTMPAQTKCKFERRKMSCGPLLSASVASEGRNHIVTFLVQKAPANVRGLLAAGVNETSIRFPGTR